MSLQRRRAVTAAEGSGTVDMSEEEAPEMPVTDLAAYNQQVLAVRRPAHHSAACRVPRNALWYAACCRDDVRVCIAVQVGGVGNPRAVGRVERPRGHLTVRGEPLSLATVAADRPDVVGVAEGDLILRKRREAQQQRRLGGWTCNRRSGLGNCSYG